MNFRVLIFLLALSSCNQQETPDRGQLKGRLYTNNYFEFSIDVPQGWIIHNHQQQEQLNDSTTEHLRQMDPELGEKLASAEENVLSLLSVFKYPVGSTEKFNPSFIVMSEKLPAKLNELAYLALTKKQLEDTGLYQTFEIQNMPVNIGGEDFYMLRVSSRQRDVVTQEFYAKTFKTHVLFFILSYTTSAEKKECAAVLDAVTFD